MLLNFDGSLQSGDNTAVVANIVHFQLSLDAVLAPFFANLIGDYLVSPNFFGDGGEILRLVDICPALGCVVVQTLFAPFADSAVALALKMR